MNPTRPIVIDEATVRQEAWNDPSKGVLAFRTLISGGLTATRSLTAGIAHLDIDGWLGLHRHSPTEIYYVVEGRGIVTLDGDDHEVTAGSTVYIPGDAEHGIRNTASARLTFFYAFAADSFTDVVYRFSS